MTDRALQQEIEQQRDLMVAVATGGPRIDTVNQAYVDRRALILDAVRERGYDDPNPYPDLWAWYGKWSSGDLPTYHSRRTFVSGLYQPLFAALDSASRPPTAPVEPTGWTKVDRDLGNMREALARARTEPDFQAVGLRCREILISLGQEVYDPTRHPTTDGVDPSLTDAKRMLEAYIKAELAGGYQDEVRGHARAALALAVALQHRRTATFRTAAICAEATTSVVDIVAILSGRRDPA